MRAVIYAQYSSDRQSDTSIEAQIEKCKQYCVEKGYTVIKEYVDRAQSAATDRRPAFQQMFQDANKKEFDVVVVYKLDRFARNLYDSVVYTKRLEQLGIALESTTEPITQDIQGKFFRNIMGAINELYVENLKQEIKDKAVVVAKKSYFMGGKPPYGYKLVDEKDEYGKIRKRYEIDENQAPFVRQIFEMAANGFTLTKIAEKLNSIGVTTNRGNAWSIRALYELILNEKYAGVFVYQRGTKHNYHAKRDDTIKIPNGIPAIVDPETYWLARQKLGVGMRKTQRHVYVLRRLAYCGVCGSLLTGVAAGKYPKYGCSYSHRYGNVKGHVIIGKMKLETFVQEHVKHTFFSDIDYERLAEEINKRIAESDVERQKEIEKLHMELAEINVKIERGTRAILEGVDLDELKGELQQLRELRTIKELELNNIKVKKETPLQVTPEGLSLLMSQLQSLLESDEEKELLYRKIIDKIVVYPGGVIDIKYKGLEEIL